MFSGFHDGLGFQLNLVSWYISTYPATYLWVTISKKLSSLKQHIFIVLLQYSCLEISMDRGARWGHKEWDTIEHTHHYSLDQESRPYFAGFSTSESHLKASTKVLAWAAVSLGVSAGDKILFQGHMTVGNITTEAVRQTSVSCSVRSSSQFLIMWLPPQGSSWHARLLQSQLGEPSRKTMLQSHVMLPRACTYVPSPLSYSSDLKQVRRHTGTQAEGIMQRHY